MQLQTIPRPLRPFIGSKAFYADALAVMIPITIQQLINNLFNTVDNLMVGSLDTEGLVMSAVNVANKPFLIFFGLFFGMTGAAGLMISQYYGARDQKTCQALFSLQLIMGLIASIVFFVLLQLFPAQLMQIFVKDPRTIALGVSYMRIVAWSYVPVAISSTCMFCMRSIGITKASMVVSMATMGINALCNYVLIFGKLGLPAMGVEGAALGTVIARVMEMLFYLWILASKRMIFTLDFRAFVTLKARVVRTYVMKAIPLISNEILWTIGLNIYFWSYATINEAALPAVTIADLCSQFAAVLSIGVSSAVSVLIGTELGASRFAQAKSNCKKLFSLCVTVALIGVMICVSLGFLLPHFFTLSKELKDLATTLAIITGLLAPLGMMYGFCFFCLRAGGDTRNAMLLDSGYMFAVPVPASIIMAVFFKDSLTIASALLIIQFLMNAKVVLALSILRKGKWIRNITE